MDHKKIVLAGLTIASFLAAQPLASAFVDSGKSTVHGEEKKDHKECKDGKDKDGKDCEGSCGEGSCGAEKKEEKH